LPIWGSSGSPSVRAPAVKVGGPGPAGGSGGVAGGAFGAETMTFDLADLHLTAPLDPPRSRMQAISA